jgi:predicted  nucleic acid-binding Zn ribbon protein
MIHLAHKWMDQPKPLVHKVNDVNSEPNAMLTADHNGVVWQIVIPHYVNLMSGKNITHSGENYVNYLIVKYMKKKHGINISKF